jgi:hypothetical protein
MCFISCSTSETAIRKSFEKCLQDNITLDANKDYISMLKNIEDVLVRSDYLDDNLNKEGYENFLKDLLSDKVDKDSVWLTINKVFINYGFSIEDETRKIIYGCPNQVLVTKENKIESTINYMVIQSHSLIYDYFRNKESINEYLLLIDEKDFNSIVYRGQMLIIIANYIYYSKKGEPKKVPVTW